MENHDIREYLINFAEKTLNEYEIFAKIYGRDFVRKRLEINLKNVDIISSNSDFNTALYNTENFSITIFIGNNFTEPVTIEYIENNKKLRHLILHEAIHAIFRRTKEECQEFGIEDGTGTLEFYRNAQELGRGLNEGLTEWICKKVGYGGSAYIAEQNIIKILEFAIGEESVLKLANGDIKGNCAQLLKMSKIECLQIMALIDRIYQNEQKVSTEEDLILNDEYRELDKNISNLETIFFEKYFKDEIETAQNTENISTETIQHLYDLVLCINGGRTTASDNFASELPLKFKNQIYPNILARYQQEMINQIKKKKQAKYEETVLPVLYKKRWLQKLKEIIKSKFIKKQSQNVEHNVTTEPECDIKRTPFKEYVSNMSNYSSEHIENTSEGLTQRQVELEKKDELDLS